MRKGFSYHSFPLNFQNSKLLKYSAILKGNNFKTKRATFYIKHSCEAVLLTVWHYKSNIKNSPDLRNSTPNNTLPDALVHGLHRRANTQDANVFHVLSDFKNTMGTFYPGYQIGTYQVAVILGNVK